jgi:HEPN domain-containing protein
MRNEDLADDYLMRAEKRLVALEALMKVAAYADVVRESQEVVELALKGLMRKKNLEVPRVHDVSSALLEHRARFSKVFDKHLSKLCEISRELRRDRELAFYGSEDLSPSEFYKKKDADWAQKSAIKTVEILKKNWSSL